MSIYRRGRIYYYNLWFNNRHIQGSTKTSNRKAAGDIEAAARVKLAKGEWDLNPDEKPNPSLREMFDGLERYFRRSPKWGAKHESNLRMVRRAFNGSIRSSEMKESAIDSYIAKMQRRHKAPATINRPLQLLARAYKLAKVVPPVAITQLSEKGNERRGFFEADEFDRLLEHLPADLHDFCRWAYWTGFRKNEIATLCWADVEPGIVRLRAVHSKNGNARSVPLNVGELQSIIDRRRLLRRSLFNDQRELVFHRDGKPVREFRKSWAKACIAAGLTCTQTFADGRKKIAPSRIFHDFRRTAVRNLVRAGVSRSVAMQISGHETESMFRRYDIGNENDLAEAMTRLQNYHQMKAAKVMEITAAQ